MRIPVFLAALLFLPSMAGATPPQIVWASETLFGFTPDTLYVLRNIEDNMGRPTAEQTDIMLVARDRKTNLDIRILPVARMIDRGSEYTFMGETEQFATLPPENRINPFDVMAAEKLRPLISKRLLPPDLDVVAVKAGPEAFIITDSYTGQGRNYTLPYAVISSAFRANLNATRDAMPAYFVEGGSKGDDLLRDVAFSPAEDCTVEGLSPLFEGTENYTTTLETTVAWIINVSCANDRTMAAHEMFFVTAPQLWTG